MAMVVACPHCGRETFWRDERLGNEVRCPGCRASYLLGGDANDDAPQDTTATTDSELQASATSDEIDWSPAAASAIAPSTGAAPTHRRKPTKKGGPRLTFVASVFAAAIIAGGSLYFLKASKHEFTQAIAQADAHADAGKVREALAAYAAIFVKTKSGAVSKEAFAALDVAARRWAELASAEISKASDDGDGSLAASFKAYRQLASLVEPTVIVPDGHAKDVRDAMARRANAFTDAIRIAGDRADRGDLGKACAQYRELFLLAKAAQVPAPVSPDVAKAVTAWGKVYGNALAEVERLLAAGDKKQAAAIALQLAFDVDGKEVPQPAMADAKRLLAISAQLNGRRSQVAAEQLP